MTNAIRLLTRADRPTRITAYPLVLVAWWDENTQRMIRMRHMLVPTHPAGYLYRKETDHANPVHAR